MTSTFAVQISNSLWKRAEIGTTISTESSRDSRISADAIIASSHQINARLCTSHRRTFSPTDACKFVSQLREDAANLNPCWEVDVVLKRIQSFIPLQLLPYGRRASRGSLGQFDHKWHISSASHQIWHRLQSRSSQRGSAIARQSTFDDRRF